MTPAVTPDPNQQPDPQVQPTPPPAQPQGPPSANAVPAPQPQQDDPNTHGWRAVLKGALQGLESHLKGAGEGLLAGGIPGAVIGAASPETAQNAMKFRRQEQQNSLDKQQADIKFTNAEAANQVADAMYRDAQRQQMPKDLQLRQDTLDEDTAKMWIGAGVYPTIVVPNTSEGAHAAAEQLQQKFGAIPSLVFLHMGNELVGFDPTALASNSAVLQQVNVLQKVTGGPPFNPATLKNAPNKTQLTQDAAHLFSPVFPGMDKAQGMISQYDGYIKKVQMWPDEDPDKLTTLDKLKSAQSALKTAYDKRNADQLAAAKARGEAAQNAKAVEVVGLNGPEDNTIRYTSAGTAKSKGLTSGSSATKAEAKIAQLEDMQTASKTARDALDKMPKAFSPATITKMAAAMRSDDQGYVGRVRDAVLSSGLSDQEAKAASAILNLQERALSLRSLGQQGQGSEQQREKIIQLLPTVKDFNNKNLIKDKLDAFDQQVSIYYKNIPKANIKTEQAPTAPSQPADNITHVSSDGKWAWNGKAWIPNPKK